MIDLNVIITGCIGIATTVVSSFITWLLSKKKYYTEVDNNMIRNMEKSLEFYEKLSTDTQKRLAEILERNDILEKKNDKCEEEINKLREQMYNLMYKICLNYECKYRIKEIDLFNNSNNK